MKKPKIIGLTGGIGSGKTTVAKIFESLGVPIYIADVEAKRLMESKNVLEQIAEKFGKSVFNEQKLDRTALAKIVFENPDKLKELNDIVHPAVAEDFKQWVAQHHQHHFVIKEAAILFETGGNKYCDKTILVTAPLEVRIKRVMKRDQVASTEIMKRIQNQWDDEKKVPLADYIIQNTDDCDLFKIVNEITKTLNNL
jgi:dephospho-CoA kinase